MPVSTEQLNKEHMNKVRFVIHKTETERLDQEQILVQNQIASEINKQNELELAKKANAPLFDNNLQQAVDTGAPATVSTVDYGVKGGEDIIFLPRDVVERFQANVQTIRSNIVKLKKQNPTISDESVERTDEFLGKLATDTGTKTYFNAVGNVIKKNLKKLTKAFDAFKKEEPVQSKKEEKGEFSENSGKAPSLRPTEKELYKAVAPSVLEIKNELYETFNNDNEVREEEYQEDFNLLSQAGFDSQITETMFNTYQHFENSNSSNYQNDYSFNPQPRPSFGNGGRRSKQDELYEKLNSMFGGRGYTFHVVNSGSPLHNSFMNSLTNNQGLGNGPVMDVDGQEYKVKFVNFNNV